ncbi:MAG: FAD-binding oxidoreductase, partial [Pseudomonadota bacterium]
GSCTIGGNIATNAGGNRVIRYGMMRDMVLGLEAVLADGTVVSSMNQMIKNNAGYDLKQLHIGGEGTLGVITRAVLRCREAVSSHPTLLVAVEDFDKLMRFLKHVDSGLGGNLSAFEVMWNNFYTLVTTPPVENQPPLPGHYDYYALVEAMGASADMVESVMANALEQELIADAVLAQSEAQVQDIWALRDGVEHVFLHGEPVLFDVSLRIPLMQDYVDEVNARLSQHFTDYYNFTFGHMGDGNLHFNVCMEDESEAARELVKQCVYEPLEKIGGSVSAEHGIGLGKKKWLASSRTDDEVTTMRLLKQALDPRGILNPGRIFD